MEELTQIGIGGIFAIMILKEVFSFLRNRNGKNNKNGYNPLQGNIKKLLDMHEKYDDEGMPVWYNGSIKKSVDKLNENVEINTKAVKELTKNISKVIE